MQKRSITCVTLSHDCQLLAMGCQSSEVLVASINPNKKLFSMKPVKYLHHHLSNPSFHGSTEYLLDTAHLSTASNERCLIGHTAAIFSLAFEPTQSDHLLSASQDCTIRLWHLLTWSCLVVYKIHRQPVLDGQFDGNRFMTIHVVRLVCSSGICFEQSSVRVLCDGWSSMFVDD